jgi:very-short-patch-repair endonuclease
MQGEWGSSDRVRGSWPETEEAAGVMRRVPTLAEERLWQALRGRKLAGLKFRRQHPLGPFILDFYCPSCHLVVELDGQVHEDSEQEARDTARTLHLRQFGLHVIRFSNHTVLTQLGSVLNRIQETAAALSQASDRARTPLA